MSLADGIMNFILMPGDMTPLLEVLLNSVFYLVLSAALTGFIYLFIWLSILRFDQVIFLKVWSGILAVMTLLQFIALFL